MLRVRDWPGASSVFLQDKWVWACFPVGKAWMDWGLCQVSFNLLRTSLGPSWRSSPSSLGSGGQNWLGPSWTSSLLKLQLLSSGNASEMGKLARDSTNYPSKLLHKWVGLVYWVWVGFFHHFYHSGYGHLCAEAAWVPHCWGSYFQENSNIKTSSTKEKVKTHASKKEGGKKEIRLFRLYFLCSIPCVGLGTAEVA